MLKKKTNKLSQEQISDIISLALSDDVSFDNIKKMYDINSDEIKRVMKDNLNYVIKSKILLLDLIKTMKNSLKKLKL